MKTGEAALPSVPHAPPHAPRTGFLKRLLGPLHFTGVFWYRIHHFGMCRMPAWTRPLIVWTFGTFFYVVLWDVRRSLGRNLELVLGPMGWWRRQREAYKALITFSWCLSERYEQFVPEQRATTTIDDEALWRSVADSGTGFIVVTAHVGNWEMGSALPAIREDRVVNLVREGELDPDSQAFIEGLLRGLGGPRYKTHFAADDPRLGFALFDALREGEIVALQADRPRAGGQVALVSLFGQKYPMPLGPAVLARSADVPLVPMFFFRTGRRRYRIAVSEPIRVAKTGNRQADCQAAVEALAAEIESAVRQAPHQWFCFADVRNRSQQIPERARGGRTEGSQERPRPTA